MHHKEAYRNKAIISGLYLSKFDKLGLAALGFNSFQEAFNILGYSLEVKPSSIKNYRDEFDPLFPNKRKGWHKRPIRAYCKEFYEKYSTLNLEMFSELIRAKIFKNYDIEKLGYEVEEKDYSNTISKRLLTGKAAEHYFELNYKKIKCFKGYNLTNTTQMACGFDYKLSLNEDFYCIEVKGVNEKRGGIQLTEKEFLTAQKIQKKYCLFVVKDFKSKPIHDLIFDPLNSRLDFKQVKREVIQISYNSYI